MKTIHVCKHCGSANVAVDAWYYPNLEKSDVFWNGCCHCNECEGATLLVMVDVPDFFDVRIDKYDFEIAEYLKEKAQCEKSSSASTAEAPTSESTHATT
jgi:hypothetical protein